MSTLFTKSVRACMHFLRVSVCVCENGLETGLSLRGWLLFPAEIVVLLFGQYMDQNELIKTVFRCWAWREQNQKKRRRGRSPLVGHYSRPCLSNASRNGIGTTAALRRRVRSSSILFSRITLLISPLGFQREADAHLGHTIYRQIDHDLLYII